MNLKGISVAAIISGIILIVVLLPTNPSDVAPGIKDELEIRDNSSLEMVSDIVDSPSVVDSTVQSSAPEVDFYLGENGTKHYRIDASDKPAFKEP